MLLSGAGSFAALRAAGSHGPAAELLPAAFYFAVALLLLAPADVLSRPSRLFFAGTLQRVLLPLQEVSWADFLLADMMTSLSKSSADLARAGCGLLAGALRCAGSGGSVEELPVRGCAHVCVRVCVLCEYACVCACVRAYVRREGRGQVLVVWRARAPCVQGRWVARLDPAAPPAPSSPLRWVVMSRGLAMAESRA